MFRLLSVTHPEDVPSAVACLQLYGLGNCVRPEDGSLKGAETCRFHRCYKFVQ
jgi:hypothetical protein